MNLFQRESGSYAPFQSCADARYEPTAGAVGYDSSALRAGRRQDRRRYSAVKYAQSGW